MSWSITMNKKLILLLAIFLPIHADKEEREYRQELKTRRWHTINNKTPYTIEIAIKQNRKACKDERSHKILPHSTQKIRMNEYCKPGEVVLSVPEKSTMRYMVQFQEDGKPEDKTEKVSFSTKSKFLDNYVYWYIEISGSKEPITIYSLSDDVTSRKGTRSTRWEDFQRRMRSRGL